MFENLSGPELVAFAESKGLSREIVGMTEEGVRNFLNGMEKEKEPVEEAKDILSWPDLKKLAKEKGINTYKKKRAEIELLLKGEVSIEEETKEDEPIEPEIEDTCNPAILDCEYLNQEIQKINQRIDRLVNAIWKSKRVKGL